MFRNRSATWILAAVAGLAVMLASGCKKKAAVPFETRPLLGTEVTIAVYDPGLTSEHLAHTFNDVFAMMTDWEKKTILPGPDNQVAAISEGAGERSIPAEKPVFDMLIEGIRLYDATGKTFDIRYGPMLDAWDFDGHPRVPSSAELNGLKPLVEQGGLFVAGNSILLAKQGMRFDVREIVTGYVFDRVAEKLAESGIRSAMISCPRVCRTMGDPPDSRGFEMTVGDPYAPATAWGTLRVPVGGTAYASAGVNRFSEGGQWYHSLLDPRTGLPAAKCEGALVQAPTAAAAQGLAYGLFVSGSTDSFDRNGKAAVGGSVIIREENSKLTAVGAGSLADKFERAR